MVTGDLGACEWFVWDLRRSGLIDRGQLDSIVSEFLKRNPRAEAPALAEYLVDQGTLTAFQAERILNGKTQGLVLGPYVLLDAIGSGSMGQVYKANSKNDGTLYAVKVLPRRSMWNVRLARRQVRSFGQFQHAAVVPFVDVGTAGGLHYLVWPLVEGAPLEQLVMQQGKLPYPQAALYALQVAQGLTVAHQNNLFHGLLKPSNIMVGADNQARVLDFGIGSLLVENEGESLVDTMSTANTLTSGLDCASPESIMEPTNRTPAGDQYSLGCTLYFCLTGRVPFPEGSAVEKMMAHQTKDAPDVRELAPDVPEGLALVVKKLMSKTPEERYTGCDELVEALEPHLGDLSAMPGGVPATAGVGRGSSGQMPGLRGSAGRMAGLPSKPGSVPGMRSPLPPSPAAARASSLGLGIGAHAGGNGSGGQVAKTRTPPPGGRMNQLPSRASFQLPADGVEPGLPPMDVTEPIAAPAANRGSTGWADDEPVRKVGGIGPIGLVVFALILMVAVYFGATLLMKQ